MKKLLFWNKNRKKKRYSQPPPDHQTLCQHPAISFVAENDKDAMCEKGENEKRNGGCWEWQTDPLWVAKKKKKNSRRRWRRGGPSRIFFSGFLRFSGPRYIALPRASHRMRRNVCMEGEMKGVVYKQCSGKRHGLSPFFEAWCLTGCSSPLLLYLLFFLMDIFSRFKSRMKKNTTWRERTFNWGSLVSVPIAFRLFFLSEREEHLLSPTKR